MSKKPIAIAFSDLHLGEYSQHNKDNKRTLSLFRVLFQIRKVAIKHNIPALCAGDLFHKPEMMSNGFFETTVQQFNRLDKKPWKLYCLSGNHDCSMSNTRAKLSPSWVKSFSTIYKFLECIDMQTKDLGNGYKVAGIPYIDHNIGLNDLVKQLASKKTILLMHTDYPGAKDTDGMEVGTVDNLNINVVNTCDSPLVLIGHIHKPQRLGKKVYMIGAPVQQRKTDMNCEMGYWLIMDDLSMKFVTISDDYPKFIEVTDKEDILDDGNYYCLVPVPVSKGIESKSISVSKHDSKTKIVRNYLKLKEVTEPHKKKTLIQIIKDVDV